MKKKDGYKNWLTKEHLKEKSLSNGCFWCSKICSTPDCPYRQKNSYKPEPLSLSDSFLLFLVDVTVRLDR